MAYSNYDASTTNKSKRSNRIYADLNLSFTKNPATKDVARLFDVQAIKRSVKNIILTNKYERPFNSDFGCNLRGFLFENVTEPLLVVIKDRVSMAIEKYEPRVSVEDVVVESDDGSNGIRIMVSFKINGVEQPVTVSTFLQRVR
jgi:phage baseplate assembly protein W|tara:strand:+ start:1013 stop:1444 length:432 start_codon:yes stop_codon:yes gene_type:complete